MKHLRHWGAHEDGQSLVIAVLSMTLIVAVAAFAIDVGNWYATRHHAQVTADAAALAGANCMAQGGTIDSTSCGLIPNSYVSKNGFNSTPTVEFNTPNVGQVTVTVKGTGSDSFASVVGVGAPKIGATAVASWRTTGQNCTTNGSGCAFIWANDTSCTTGSSAAVSITSKGTPDTFSGGVHSNGTIYTYATGNPIFNAYQTYNTTCPAPSGNGENNYKTPNGTAIPPVGATPDTSWPIDYSQVYTACSGADCTGPGGTPSFCTYAAASFPNATNSMANPGIYCAYGTSTTPGDPTTWTGTITSGGASGQTFIGGTVTISSSGNTPITPYGSNRLLAWATQRNPSGGDALTVSTGGTETLGGDMFAPNGTANVSMGGTPTTGNLGAFIEALDVIFTSNGTVQADGPNDNPNGNPPPPTPTDSLTS